MAAPASGGSSPNFNLIDASHLNFEKVELFRDFGRDPATGARSLRWRVTVSESAGNILYIDTQAKTETAALTIINGVAQSYKGLNHTAFERQKERYRGQILHTHMSDASSANKQGHRTFSVFAPMPHAPDKLEKVSAQTLTPKTEIKELERLGALYANAAPTTYRPIAPYASMTELAHNYQNNHSFKELNRELQKSEALRRGWFIKDQLAQLDGRYEGLSTRLAARLGGNSEEHFKTLSEDRLFENAYDQVQHNLNQEPRERDRFNSLEPVFRSWGRFAALDAAFDYRCVRDDGSPESIIHEIDRPCCYHEQLRQAQSDGHFTNLLAEFRKPDDQKNADLIRGQLQVLERIYPGLIAKLLPADGLDSDDDTIKAIDNDALIGGLGALANELPADENTRFRAIQGAFPLPLENFFGTFALAWGYRYAGTEIHIAPPTIDELKAEAREANHVFDRINELLAAADRDRDAIRREIDILDRRFNGLKDKLFPPPAGSDDATVDALDQDQFDRGLVALAADMTPEQTATATAVAYKLADEDPRGVNTVAWALKDLPTDFVNGIV